MSTTPDLPTNWGRWGESDDLGTLNLVTEEVRTRGLAAARTGRVISLGRRIQPAPLVAGPGASPGAPTVAALQASVYTRSPVRALAELLILQTHSPETTHLDSLAHQVLDGRVYPGVSLDEAAGPDGVRRGSTAAFEDGIVTRGVLLDLAPDGVLPEWHAVTGGDLDQAAERIGVEVLPGDALVIRGGWDNVTDHGRRFPGMDLDAIKWIHRHEISVYAGDIGDARPPLDPALPAPLHRVGLARFGLPLIDAADPTRLAAACKEERRWSFLFVAAPPRLQAASGVPVNPIAIL